MRWAIALVLVAALTGCNTLERRQAQLDKTCQGYGFKPGTDAYRNCWMQVDQAQRSRAASAGPVICTGSGATVICQ